MDNLTHTLFGLTLAQTRLRHAGPGTTVALVIASNGPDADIVAGIVGDAVSYLAAHRGPTHGLPGLVGFSLATAALVCGYWLLRGTRGVAGACGRILGVSAVGVAGHILMDFPTSYRTRILSPFDWSWYQVDWVPIVDVYMWAVLGAGLIGCLIWRAARARIAGAVLLVLLADYALRAGAHALALSRSRARSDRAGAVVAALPTFVSPFVWRIVRRLPGAFEVSEIDLLRLNESPPARFVDERGPLVDQARHTRTARVFLDFARFPAAQVFHRPDGSATVRWIDMRFVGRLTLPPASAASSERPGGVFVVRVGFDRDGRIVSEELGAS